MTALILLSLLAASSGVDLADDVYEVPVSEWRWVEVRASDRPTVIAADFEVLKGPRGVKLAILKLEDLDRLREDRAHGVIASTAASPNGRLRASLVQSVPYAIVLDNRAGDAAATVHLRVRMIYGADSPKVTLLSRKRQITVILVSFAAFFGIVTWSARRLLSGIKG